MQHLIGKQILDLWVDRKLDVLALQQRASDRFWIDIVPELEKLFDRISNADATIKIDKLEIDLGFITEEMIDSGSWAGPFREKLEEALRKAMIDVSMRLGGSIVPVTDNSFTQWVYFIEHGYLPWSTGRPAEAWFQQVIESLAINYESAATLRQLIRSNTPALQRIILNHPPEFLSHLAEVLTAQNQNSLSQAITELAAWLGKVIIKPSTVSGFSNKAIERAVWTAILQKIAVDQTHLDTPAIVTHLVEHWLRLTPESLSARLKQSPTDSGFPVIAPVFSSITKKAEEDRRDIFLPKPPGKAEEELKEQKAAKTRALPEAEAERKTTPEQPGEEGLAPEETINQVLETIANQRRTLEPTAEEQATAVAEGIYISHAGLVLLHPFIHHFFRKLELVKAGSFQDEAKQQRAICLLHSLVEPGEPVREYNLVLAKLFCGWPLHKPAETDFEPTEAENEEMQQLLLAAISQWEILKNTSPAALQETFLQRGGKLLFKNQKWNLQVEKNSVDILLGHLPWTISMIKLPWMKELLLVEWA